ncbi:MAG: PIG-L family deacetylase [Nitrospiraceae bacterium]|nr:PIG-L family deacetylase [Nitrospiraceae bacterium]
MNVLVIAPHPDDETLGCGGTLLRHVAEGDSIHWIIVTHAAETLGYSQDFIRRRERELDAVTKQYKFVSRHNFGFPPSRLDTVPLADIIAKLSIVFKEIVPEIVYVPFCGDAHSDHAVVFDAVSACTKWFRYPSVKRVLAYETLSETDFGLNPDRIGFTPTVFTNIGGYLEQKIAIMREYQGELGSFPFPRSEETIKALAQLRGACAGFQAAEAFVLLKESR